MKTIILVMLFTLNAFAQDFTYDKEKGRAVPNYIGQLKLLKGSAYKKAADGTVTDVETGERFRKSDSVITKDKSFAKIQLIDDTVISVGGDSEVKFDEFDFTEKTNRNFLFTLVRGQLTGDVKNKAKPDQLKFRTKYTTMGIRGTYILMNAQTKDAMEIAQYALLSGKAEVTDQKAKYDLKKGDHITIVTAQDSTDHEAQNLNDLEMKTLSAQGLDETKEFKPFLPYFDPATLEETSILNKYFTSNTVQKKDKTVTQKREEKKPSWQENLQKLNEKLKKNQKK